MEEKRYTFDEWLALYESMHQRTGTLQVCTHCGCYYARLQPHQKVCSRQCKYAAYRLRRKIREASKA